MAPPLGFIRVQDRTPEQQDAHEEATLLMMAYLLPVPKLAKGDSIRLFDFWKHPVVVADVGLTFTRIHQITGSCVWAGGTNAVFSTIAVQRLAADSPTKAFLPFTLQNYGMSRHYMGDDGAGEGSMGSTFAKSLTTDGIRDWAPDAGLPTYTTSDGISVAKGVEMAWSSYRDADISKVLQMSKQHLFGSAAECTTTDQIAAMIANGYGVSFACDRFIGNGEIVGDGKDACVMGKWDSRGGHQESIHAVWEHPTLGRLFWVQNNWPGDTYPIDPAGGPVCGVWVLDDDVTAALEYNAEVYGLSHLNWFPAQPRVLDYSGIFG